MIPGLPGHVTTHTATQRILPPCRNNSEFPLLVAFSLAADSCHSRTTHNAEHGGNTIWNSTCVQVYNASGMTRQLD